MRRYRPDLKFGIRNNKRPDKGIRFAIFTEKLTGNKQSLADIALRINNMSVETYLLVKLESNKSQATAAMIRRMRELGVRRVGVSSGVKGFIKFSEQLLAIKTTIKAKMMLGFRS